MSAQSKADTLQQGTPGLWFTLEKAAFAAHSSALRAPHKIWTLFWAVPAVIVFVAGYTAPIWGMAAIAVSPYQDYHQSSEARIPLAGTIYIFAVLTLVVSIVHWIVRRPQVSGVYKVQAGLALVLGAATAVAMSVWGMRDAVESWHTWVIPVIAAAVLGAGFLLFLILVRDRLSPQAPDDGTGIVLEPVSKGMAEKLERRRERIAQLSHADRDAIAKDLAAAINDLESRGIVTSEAAETARSMDLGTLGLRMPIK